MICLRSRRGERSFKGKLKSEKQKGPEAGYQALLTLFSGCWAAILPFGRCVASSILLEVIPDFE